MNRITTALAGIGLTATIVMTPTMSFAGLQHHDSHRQVQKNQWRNIGLGAAAVGLYGLLNHNSTLTLLGGAGAGYSAYRYEQDRKAQNRNRRYRYYRSYNRYYPHYASYRGSHVPRGHAYGWYKNHERNLRWEHEHNLRLRHEHEVRLHEHNLRLQREREQEGRGH